MLPGIEMPFSIPDQSERKDIIAYIGTLTSVPNAAESTSASVFDDGARTGQGGATRSA